MKKEILCYVIASIFLTLSMISISHASESEKLAVIGKSCEQEKEYQSCISSKFFNSIN